MKKAVIYVPMVTLPNYDRQSIIDNIKNINDKLYKDYNYELLIIDTALGVKEASEMYDDYDVFITLSPFNGKSDNVVSKDSDGTIFVEEGNDESFRLAGIININSLYKLPIKYQSTIYTKSENKKAMIRIVHRSDRLYIPGLLASINLYFDSVKKSKESDAILYRVMKPNGSVIISGHNKSSIIYQCDMNPDTVVVNNRNEVIHKSRSSVVQKARLVSTDVALVKDRYKKIYKR